MNIVKHMNNDNKLKCMHFVLQCLQQEIKKTIDE